MNGTSNGSFVVERGSRDVLVAVKQGPEWLAALLFNPPELLLPFLAAAVCLLGAGALWKLRQYGIDADTVEGIGFNLAIIGCVAGAVLGLRSWAAFSYAVDAGGGFVIGMVAAWGLRRWLIRPLVAEHWPPE